MPVIPHCPNLFEDYQTLYQFLVELHKNSLKTKLDTIVSISLEIQPVDPLAVLHAFAEPNQLIFYLEKASQSQAVAAVGSALHLTVEGGQRFDRAQDFIRSCLAHTMATGPLHLPFAGPHFFCSFTFFEQNRPENSTFPPATVFLPRWQVARRNNRCVLVANFLINSEVNISLLSRNIWQKLGQVNAVKQNLLKAGDSRDKLIKKSVNTPDNFEGAVRSALDSIQANQYRKIVLARAIDVTSQTPFHIFHSLNQLRRLHPDCYIFATGNGQGQTFIGASPERLVSLHDRHLTTDALAGSAPRGQTPAEDDDLAQAMLNSEKERREHQAVIDFIVERLSHLGLAPQLSSPARLLQLANIQHLWTPIHARVPAEISLLDIVAELHPTPAVAGVPRDIACQEIRRYETFDRSLYAAPLGWLDHQGNGEFIVGIRSAIIDGCHARLFAGAGIVAGSAPEKELAEIQLKLQALLKALV
jgi:menaquinone-specific isochorismate synthase